MKWLSERDILIPKCENFRDFGHSEKFTKKIRGETLVKNNYTCRCCGGVYPKYLICCYLTDAKCNDVLCRACYLITHLNNGMFREIKLYYSNESQLNIVRKTVEYIIDNNVIPIPTKIDPDVKIAPLTLLEYINILNNTNEYPIELQNYKIFFTNKLNIDFIINNYGKNMVMFLDYQDTDENKVKTYYTLKKHIPSKEELDLINKYYA
jgi:hypothetical protein